MSKPPKVTMRKCEPLQHWYIDRCGNRYSVAKLIDDTKHLDAFDVPVAALNVGDEIWRGCSILELASHVRQVMDADLSYPILIDWNGDIADGRHRIIKALATGKRTILAKRITWKPDPCKEADTQ